MAIKKYRLVKPAEDGTSDTIHLETSADLVKRADGSDVETALNSLKSDIDSIELTPGPKGDTGATGATGPAGPGIATGGAVDQVLAKNSANNYDTKWITPFTAADTAAAATKLATPRTIRTNLASADAVNFDGSANVTPGVTGTLPIANGGTGVTSIDSLKEALGITVSTIATPSKPSAYYLTTASVGSQFDWAGTNWRIVHRETGYMVVALTYWEEDIEDTSRTFEYINSTLYHKCFDFANAHGLFGCDYLVNIGGLPCFVPTSSEIVSYSYYVQGVTDTTWYQSEYSKNEPLTYAKFRMTTGGSAYHDWYINYYFMSSTGATISSGELWGIVDTAGVRVTVTNKEPHGFRPHVIIRT